MKTTSKTLRLKNFRQFKGKSEMTFSCNANRNVTVILGDNSFGKTTLLQAFNWCLYGKANFFNNKQLLNYDISLKMKPGEQETVEVEITLLHSGAEYIITRRQIYNCGGGVVSGENKPTVFASCKQADGQTKPIDSARLEEVINGILPEDLMSYFFFDTERISNISERKDLSKAIKDFLGLSAIENAARHLGDRSKKSSVIGKIYAGMDFKGDERAQEALNKIQSAKEEREGIAERLKECKAEIARYVKRKDEIEQILRENQSTSDLQKRKDKLEKDLKEAEKKRVKEVEDYFKAFNEGALKFFISPLLNEAERILNEVKAYDKGVRDITKTSILELIKRGYCLCGRKICEGNDAYNHLMAEISPRLFETDYIINGEHATRLKFLAKKNSRDTDFHDNPQSAKIFERYIDVYMNAAVWGIYYRRRAQNNKSTKDNAAIRADAFIRERDRCIFLYRLVMLLDDSENLSPTERVDRAFRYDTLPEKSDELKKNMELFNDYVRGGIDLMYEKFTGCMTRDDYLEKTFEVMTEFKSELEGIDYSTELAELMK